MNEQEAWWAGPDGDAYTGRNRIDWRARIPFWAKIIDRTGARSVYEFGCNAGYNLSAIRRAFPDVAVSGEDLNDLALCIGRSTGLDIDFPKYKDDTPQAMRHMFHEISFTSGVLIHIAPENLRAFMQRVVDASSDWVLAVEYEADEVTEIDYRGRRSLLWKRDYGKLYQEMGLKLIERTIAPAPAFDNCTYWLMRKP